ncbi:AraC family transcriptional regulator [Paenibacillus sp. ACRRY]|uniref:helix-turn-helix domain-containing protein n=1 Tax=Paenibacillus sp. ACRRY TaxID=2918208 RepID=UPI001EF515DF|nr:AraC family transcriptional regulator [Paenibacillus sp. ACRRY]MCG7384394.1 AraC family transcriptional regulator [Paenibacillus sp. ACRRY]
MIPTMYELHHACIAADSGTIYPVRMNVEHPTLIFPMSETVIRLNEREYHVGSGKCLFLHPTQAELCLEPTVPEDAKTIYMVTFDRYQLVEQKATFIRYELSNEQLPEEGGIFKFSRQWLGQLQELVERAMNAAVPERHWRVSTLLNELLHGLFAHWSDAEGQYIEDMTIKQICTYMQQHLNKDLNRSDLARMTGFNPSYFSSLFRKETGWSFGDYLNRLRLDEAKRLLLTTTGSLQDIAFRAGFSDSSYLSKTFKRHVHITPTAFRNLKETNRIAALQFVGALLSIGLTPVITTQEVAGSSRLLEEDLQESVITDNPEMLDQLREVGPDLILAPTYFYHFPDVIRELEQIAPVIMLEWGKMDKLEEVLQVGSLFGREQEARLWIAHYKERVSAARSLLEHYLLPGQTVGIYELNYDQRWLMPHDKVRSAYNLYRALEVTPPARIQTEVLDQNRPIFIQEEDMPEYAADHMFVILPELHYGYDLEKLLSRQVWRQLVMERGCRVYPLILNEFWMDEGVSLEKQLEVLVERLTNEAASQPLYMGQTQP